jgi:nicotinamide phosphoribosyltransferase
MTDTERLLALDIENPTFLIDFYKAGHIFQYPDGITRVFSSWTPRSSRIPGVTKVINFGFTYFAKKYLIEAFNKHFFSRPEDEVMAEYDLVMSTTIGLKKTDHIRALHRLQYLPIEVWSLPEGVQVPLNVPPIIVVNTHPDFAWLTNYIETLMSCILWKPATSATKARRYRAIGMKHARAAGERDFSFVDWQFHDFSERGMAGLEDACLSGMGHLLSFSGTDTLPAILTAVKYYRASLDCGGSVNATEHSVMCAGGEDNELETFERLLFKIYPEGILSVVSDTWDLWVVLTDIICKLKERIHARNGKLVIRPDSGDPVKIVLGNEAFKGMNHQYKSFEHPAYLGAMECLRRALGTVPNLTGVLPLIHNGGLIYGDAITEERADEILGGVVKQGLSPYNMVLGIGSYTYEYVTRDTFGNAMKAIAIEKNGKVIAVFKRPVTDSGGKFSHKGLVAVYRSAMSTEDEPEYELMQNVTEEEFRNCAYEQVFCNSELIIDPLWADIRRRVRSGM